LLCGCPMPGQAHWRHLSYRGVPLGCVGAIPGRAREPQPGLRPRGHRTRSDWGDGIAPPRERTVVEGNIVEHPIWKLSNRQARPKRTMVDEETGKALINPDTRKVREYVDPAD